MKEKAKKGKERGKEITGREEEEKMPIDLKG